MIGNQLEHDILRVFLKDVTQGYSINHIARLLKKQYPYIHKKITEFIDANILTKQVIGRSYLCTLNYKEPQTRLLTGMMEQKRARHQVNDTLLLLTKQHAILTIIKTKNNYHVITQDEQTKQKLTNILPKQIILETKQELQSQLLINKQIITDHIIIYGYEQYGIILSEIQEQLRGKWLFA